jgi:Nif-specific regulatory protein
MPYLIVREPGQVTFTVPLRGEVVVGRHERCDLVLCDHRVSRRHAQISSSERGFALRDLGSTHGTLVNGAQVGEHALRDGDRIQVGGVLLTFSAGDEPQEIVHQQITAAAPPAGVEVADQRLRLLYEVTRAIRAMGDSDALLGDLLRGILDVLGCERALFGLREIEGAGLRRIVRQRGGAGPDDVVVSRLLLDTLLERREGVIVRDATGRDAPRTLVRERIACAMGAPLQAGARLFGFVYVDDRERTGLFEPRDLDFLIALGHLTAAALESAERYQRAASMVEALGAAEPTGEILGASAPVQRLRAQIRKFGAASGANVLIRGESGTGKELVARALHAASARAARSFVTVNCAAIPESMIEAELFGHERGAFTGAVRDRRGKFVLADRGTLFLDEIGDLNPSAQSKLLRAIQEGEIQPLGSERTLRVDVRIVSATHKDLRAEIDASRFREDLYYRLNVIEIEVPPLRERGEDVDLLARALLQSAAAGMGKRIEGFTPAAVAALRRYPWPGNVRELKNEVERAAITTESPVIEASDLSPRLLSAPRGQDRTPAEAPLSERFAELEIIERRLVEEALDASGGNLSEAARRLGISRVMLKRRAERFGLRPRDDERH